MPEIAGNDTARAARMMHSYSPPKGISPYPAIKPI